MSHVQSTIYTIKNIMGVYIRLAPQSSINNSILQSISSPFGEVREGLNTRSVIGKLRIALCALPQTVTISRFYGEP